MHLWHLLRFDFRLYTIHPWTPFHPIAGYMAVMGSNEINGVDACLTSPGYDTSKTHCLSFEYEVIGEKAPGASINSPALNVYSRCQSNLFAGDKIWGASQTSKGMVKITVLSTERVVDCYIDFVGRLRDAEADKVALTNVLFSEGFCDDRESAVCQDGDFMCENNFTCGPAASRCGEMATCQVDTQKLQCGESCLVHICYSRLI